ncbi:branched-chain amino acid ABC transporter substrate-binding protein [Schlegelella koreensis]|uniref:Branched-chain amino acid ABC transporter substrate-binding protein n=1 Tax=Piscinibacter koreensis TaxID=2742824 RepID=A0A7Y6NKD1_9BURK|nr:branched-chain amino acid ABC transporter substrate-binding protein [Schlegelella koreensis]NUZ04767.1 branched-chain amino acid ABC transporter substrate-binding protein [Schlegelella koreensis]
MGVGGALSWLLALALAIGLALVGTAHAAEPAATPIRLALIESLSGPFANTGEASLRNLAWAVERVNQRGGVALPASRQPLALLRYDSNGGVEGALAALRSAIDDGARVVLQGNSSAVALALVEAIDKHNQRDPARRVLFLNYAAVDPALTNESCSYWHFRFDAHADMRVAALMQLLQDDRAVTSAYLIAQDYSFGRAVLLSTRRELAARRPDVRIVGEELHPLGRIKDFVPYALKIKASGAQAVVTPNWGNDLTLLAKAAAEVGFTGRFYTFYGNALGAPAAIGTAGIGRVVALAEWMPNVTGAESERLYAAFRTRFPDPRQDYLHLRYQLMIEALVQAIERAGSTRIDDVAARLETARVSMAGSTGFMRADDHQFIQPLVIGVMDRQGTPGVRHDVEGSGYGFRIVRTFAAEQTAQPTTCRMVRPD